MRWSRDSDTRQITYWRDGQVAQLGESGRVFFTQNDNFSP